MDSQHNETSISASGANYQTVDLPTRSKQVTLFVDEETGSKLSTRSMGPDGKSNVLVAQLYLDRLGIYGQIFRFLGLLSTLYVRIEGNSSETSNVEVTED